MSPIDRWIPHKLSAKGISRQKASWQLAIARGDMSLDGLRRRVWKRTAKGRRRRWKGKNREINEGDKQKGGRKEAQNPFIVYYTQSRWSPASFRELKRARAHTHTHTHTHLSQRSLELLSLYQPPPPLFTHPVSSCILFSSFHSFLFLLCSFCLSGFGKNSAGLSHIRNEAASLWRMTANRWNHLNHAGAPKANERTGETTAYSQSVLSRYEQRFSRVIKGIFLECWCTMASETLVHTTF